MKEVLDHWKEGLGVLAYFGFLAYFTPKAEALGWGYRGLLFCVVVGALLVFLLYLIVKYIAEYIADHREEVSSFREYMGIGAHPEQVSLASIGTIDDHTADELDAMLATNPYASPEVFDDDKYTRLLPSVGADTRVVDEADLAVETGEEITARGGRVAAIIGENPRRRLILADNFQPDANDPLATGVAAFGMQGSGKTNVLIRFLEQYIRRYRLPCVVFDSQGDWKSLVEDGFCPRGVIATPQRMPTMTHVVTLGLQVVIDLSEWHEPDKVEMSHELAARMMARVIRDLMAAQKTIESGNRISCLVGIDEIHLWVPQTAPSYLTPPTAKSLLDAVIALATTGRKLGVVPLFATQRIAKVNKDVIGSVETRIFGKADLDNDLNRYREYVGTNVVTDDQIRAFGPGKMVVCMNGKKLLTQFYPRETRHISHTPHLTQSLDRFVGKLPPELLAHITRPVEDPQFAPMSVPRPAPLHTEPPVPTRERKTSGPLTVVAQEPPAEIAPPQPASAWEPQVRMGRVDLQKNPALRTALTYYQEGYTSHRDLARVMGVSHGTAGKYIAMLKAMGEIAS